MGGVIPRGFVAAVEKGVRAALSEGPQGHPVVGLTVTLIDGQTHAKDSSDMAFHRAGVEAVKAALAQGGTRLLEPVMEVAIHVPSVHVGDVVGDLNRRHGRVSSIDDLGGRAEVVAHPVKADAEISKAVNPALRGYGVIDPVPSTS